MHIYARTVAALAADALFLAATGIRSASVLVEDVSTAIAHWSLR